MWHHISKCCEKIHYAIWRQRSAQMSSNKSRYKSPVLLAINRMKCSMQKAENIGFIVEEKSYSLPILNQYFP